MKYKILFIIVLVLISTFSIQAEAPKPGYTDWSTNPSGNEYEESVVQYGRRVPAQWSDWSETKPSTADQKSKEGQIKKYVNRSATNSLIYFNANAKTIYTWNFGQRSRVVYFYADVDTYVYPSLAYYEAPPLQLYCDNSLIASTGTHDVLKNWNPNVNTSCTTMQLRMSDNSSHGRNRTAIVGTWATTLGTLYSYVVSWTDGRDWRTTEPYTRVYGENAQIPTSRVVYSYPITYSITYHLDEGTPVSDLPKSYTVLDDVELPICTKRGYDFLGYYDSKGNLINEIKKGSYGNLVLYAKYKRRLPVLYVGYTYFDVGDINISSDDVIKQVNARAIDELEGDLSDKIVIKSIYYEQKNKIIEDPEYLELDSEDIVNITFSVSNNVGGEATVTRKFYILGKGKSNDDYVENVKIYSRFIDEEYLYTLDEYSVWNTNDYKNQLYKAFSFMEEK